MHAGTRDTRTRTCPGDPHCCHCCRTLKTSTTQAKHPCILQHFDSFLERVNGKRVAVFLDYDGARMRCSSRSTSTEHSYQTSILNTPLVHCARCVPVLYAGTLTPIVNNPDQAIMSPQVGLSKQE